jgi:hypothetical protein
MLNVGTDDMTPKEMLYWYGGQVLSVGTDDMTPKEILYWYWAGGQPEN